MARKPMDRALPPLREVLRRFRGFSKEEHRLKVATGLMREAARRLQKSKSQPFYSMREAARFFAVPHSLLSRAYQNLEEEGLVVRVRGSRTVLVGKASRSLHTVRSIVTIPVFIRAMIGSSFTRNFCYQICGELWRHRFAANLMLCTFPESLTSEFAHRLLKQADIAIWMFPHRRVRETLLTLHDHGVQNVVLSAGDNLVQPASYIMDWAAAYRRAVAVWKAEGIRQVVVAGPSVEVRRKEVDNFLAFLRECGLTGIEVAPNSADLLRMVRRQSKNGSGTACAIVEHDVTDHLCSREPEAMAQLTTLCRVLFGRGVVLAPYFAAHRCTADVIGFSGYDVATRIARDLSRRLPAPLKAPRLAPRWMPQVNMGDVFV